jgi:hypothetical protein
VFGNNQVTRKRQRWMLRWRSVTSDLVNGQISVLAGGQQKVLASSGSVAGGDGDGGLHPFAVGWVEAAVAASFGLVGCVLCDAGAASAIGGLAAGGVTESLN